MMFKNEIIIERMSTFKEHFFMIFSDILPHHERHEIIQNYHFRDATALRAYNSITAQ